MFIAEPRCSQNHTHTLACTRLANCNDDDDCDVFGGEINLLSGETFWDVPRD